jgi:hypothetical protein
MKITVEVKTVYGEERIYPVCENARIFAALVKQTTLTRHNLAHIKQLGYAIEQKQQELAI